ncbi:MAG: DegT/DnrJ/EryC1/StrS family aminotransferase [Chloroflexi bacterium]|nr:DegT/DnrJ/EryC1/StrS family aminotransferase [Chloroflexota bacterium]
MTALIREVQAPRLKRYPRLRENWEQGLFPGEPDVEIILTDSGKAALFILLSYYRSIGRIEDKNSEILVPRWIGAWVYNILLKSCFPHIEPNPRIRGIVLYHQYGYPQQMDEIMALAAAKGWFVVEDCAHAIRSFLGTQRLGLIGDAGILSFSKFFPSVMGGAIITRDKAIAAYARKVAERNHRIVSEFSYLTKWVASHPWMKGLSPFSHRLVEMSYGVYDLGTRINSRAARIVAHELRKGSLDRRDSNKDFFLSELKRTGVFDRLDHCGITPYVLPLFAPRKWLEAVELTLREVGVETGIYHFDVNRNMLDPHFEECLWVPVHPGVTEPIREKMADAVRRVLG